ncbi:MAG: MFS transporter [Chloroflexota bacterium]|nr:MFS transporter [Chloroflexota bacterium]MDE2885011.1 MFS transporter [Chloroflexota bacterium]
MQPARPPLLKATLFIYLPSMLMSMGQGMIIPALPAIAREFNVSPALAVQVITSQLIGRTASMLPSGAIVDRFGAKPLMIGGSILATVSTFAAAMAPSFTVIIVTQFFWGIGMSTWMFGREVAAVDMVRREQRGRQMSALMGIGSTGMAFGPALGGVLTDLIGVRGLFFVYAGMAAVVLVISLAHREISRPRPRRTSAPLFDIRAVREIHPYYRVTYLILFYTTFAQFIRGQVTNVMLPLYVQTQLGYSASLTGVLFTAAGVATFLMIVPTGIISDKLGRKWAAGPAALLSTVAFVAFPLATNIPLLFAVMCLVGLANGLAMGAMTIYTYDVVPMHVRGQLQALRRGIGEVGALTSPPSAALIASAFTPGLAFLFFAPLHVLSALLIFGVARESLQGKRKPGAPSSQEIDEGASSVRPQDG